MNSMGESHRLLALVRTVEKEIHWLKKSDERLFSSGFNLLDMSTLDEQPDVADKIEAFVARFGRCQDTIGDKLLPVVLRWKGEKTLTVIDNLNRASRLGWLDSVELWVEARNLRNQMVHEYVENAEELSAALWRAHELLPTVIGTAIKLLAVATGEDQH